MAVIIPILFTVFVIYILSFYNTIRKMIKFHSYGSKIPGPPSHPIFGNAKFFSGKSGAEVIDFFKENARKVRESGQSVMRFQMPGKLIIWPLTGQTVAKIIESSTEIHKGDDYSFFDPWIGQGLLVAVGDRWKTHRKMITPTFHFAKLEGYLDVFNSESKILVYIIGDYADNGNTIDMMPFIKRCTLDIICGTAMGTKVDAQYNHNHKYVEATEGYTRMMLKYSFNPLLWNKFVFWALGYRKQCDEYLYHLKKFTSDVIKERRNGIESGEVEKESSKRKMNFLDSLLNMKESNVFSEEEIREEVDTFMFGGHDTTTTSASWTCWNLAHNPDIQQKVFEELIEVVGDNISDDITYEQINQLSYLDKVLKESKRIIAPVPAFQRKLQKELIIDGYTIPSEANVAIAPVALHDNHLVWTNPDVFDPERFSPEEISKRHPYDYLPFSAGVKNCIGQKFSMLNEKVMISHIIRNFKLVPKLGYHETKPSFEIVAKPSKGIPIQLIRRV